MPYLLLFVIILYLVLIRACNPMLWCQWPILSSYVFELSIVINDVHSRRQGGVLHLDRVLPGAEGGAGRHDGLAPRDLDQCAATSTSLLDHWEVV